MRLAIVFHRVSPVSSTFFHNEAPCKGPTRSNGSWLNARFTVRKSKKKKAAAHSVVRALLYRFDIIKDGGFGGVSGGMSILPMMSVKGAANATYERVI